MGYPVKILYTKFSSEGLRTGAAIVQNTIRLVPVACTNEENNSFLVHSVFPDSLGPVTIIENGCLNVISFNGCNWSVYFPLPWT